MIDKDKQYTTRDGREVRIYATDCGGLQPVHGAIKSSDGWSMDSWTQQGTQLGQFESFRHLIEVKQRMKFERWYLFTSQGDYSIWQSKPDASSAIDAFAIKHIVFEVEEGEGLDAV
jgi:hypothetical protein